MSGTHLSHLFKCTLLQRLLQKRAAQLFSQLCKQTQMIKINFLDINLKYSDSTPRTSMTSTPRWSWNQQLFITDKESCSWKCLYTWDVSSSCCELQVVKAESCNWCNSSTVTRLENMGTSNKEGKDTLICQISLLGKKLTQHSKKFLRKAKQLKPLWMSQL